MNANLSAKDWVQMFTVSGDVNLDLVSFARIVDGDNAGAREGETPKSATIALSRLAKMYPLRGGHHE